jgi:hypothetical protein
LELLLLHLAYELRRRLLVAGLDDLLFHVDLTQPEGALVAARRGRGIGLGDGGEVLSGRRVGLVVALHGIRRERVVREHRSVALDILFPVLRGDSVLDVQLLLLGAEVVALGTESEILGAVEVEPLLPGVFHGEVVTPDVDLVKLVRVDEHLPFRLA